MGRLRDGVSCLAHTLYSIGSDRGRDEVGPRPVAPSQGAVDEFMIYLGLRSFLADPRLLQLDHVGVNDHVAMKKGA